MTDYRYAGFWLRFIAIILDRLVQGAVLVPMYFVVMFLYQQISDYQWTADELQETVIAFMYVIFIPLDWIYYTAFESTKWQATPGKKLMALKVTDLSGDRIGFGKANARYWSKILSTLILYIGYIMVGCTERKQGLHDIIARALVVKE